MCLPKCLLIQEILYLNWSTRCSKELKYCKAWYAEDAGQGDAPTNQIGRPGIHVVVILHRTKCHQGEYHYKLKINVIIMHCIIS